MWMFISGEYVARADEPASVGTKKAYVRTEAFVRRRAAGSAEPERVDTVGDDLRVITRLNDF
jgi:hypothetical protein